jgi:hypothetical protein
MFVLPKGTLVHYRGMPFTLLSDSPTDALEANYNLALSHPVGSIGSSLNPAQAQTQTDAAAAARHELVTLDGLVAADCAAPDETWVLDVKATIKQLDDAFNATGESGTTPS